MIKSTYIYALIIGLLFTACNKDKASTKELFFFRNDGSDMLVNIEGNISSNTFILLLHGGPGGSGADYNFGTYTKDLEERYAIIYWDQRGQGGSTGQYKASDVTVSKMAEDCAALTRAIKLKYGEDADIFLLGHSWGGMLGTAALVETDIQNDLNGWIDVDGAHNIPLLNREAIIMFEYYADIVLQQEPQHAFWNEIKAFTDTVDINNISIDEGGSINSYGHQAESYIANITHDDDAEEFDYFNYVFINPTGAYHSSVNGFFTSNQLYQEVESKAYLESLNKINLPCLFQWGRFDFVVPPAVGIDAYNGVSTPASQKEFIYYDQSGHSPMSNEPAQFVADIVDFVERYK